MTDTPSASAMVDLMIAALHDWRGVRLAHFRALIREADPDIVETVKWRKPTNPDGVPVWEHAGIVCTGGVFKSSVKLSFAKGALLDDPDGLFNGSLNGNTMRAIDVRKDHPVDNAAFRALILRAVAFNRAGKS